MAKLTDEFAEIKDEKNVILRINKLTGLIYKFSYRLNEVETALSKLAKNISKSNFIEALCTLCRGKGKLEDYNCPKCKGKGL